MDVSKVSSKYQIVIPKQIRERLGIRPGETVEFQLKGDRAELERVPELAELEGIWKDLGLPRFQREREADRW